MLTHQLGDEIQSGLRVLAAFALRGIRSQQVPLGRTGTQRAGADDLEAGLQQIVPVLDVLRVALAHNQSHHRPKRDTAECVLIPVRGNLLGLDQPGDIRLHREVHDVGGLAALDPTGLVAGGTVGLGDLDALTGLCGVEGRNDLAEARLGNRIGHQGERGVGISASTPAGNIARPTLACGGQRDGDDEGTHAEHR
ncbi:Uncharacterised protein [Mycobacteroides abscessus]|nr:Uncharacterised protein [Mycobacteroides abscessus]